MNTPEFIRRRTEPRLSIEPRVLHVVPALFGKNGVFGGAERYAFELARSMAERVPTTLVAFGQRDESFTEGRLRVRVIAGAREVRGQSHNRVSARLVPLMLRADVVHCHQRHLLQSTICAAVGRLAGKRVFTTELGGGGWDIGHYVPTDRWFSGHLHISRYSEEVAKHAANVKSGVIYGGVDIETFKPDRSVPRERAVLFVGRLLPHKGIDALVRAMRPDVPLWIVGTESDTRYVGDLKELAAGKRVAFLGGLSDREVVDHYRRAACCVLPSVYRTLYGDETLVPELLGQTLLEAMACETPVICTRVASMPEIVDDGTTGFVVPPYDVAALSEKLSWCLDHPDEARAMGYAGRRAVERRFTWPVVVERCLRAYAGQAEPLAHTAS